MQDLRWLDQDFEIYLCNLFDCSIALFLLHHKKNGLAHLIAHYCSIQLDKSHAHSDWSQRPFCPFMKDYTCADVKFLLFCHDCLCHDLSNVKVPLVFKNNWISQRPQNITRLFSRFQRRGTDFASTQINDSNFEVPFSPPLINPDILLPKAWIKSHELCLTAYDKEISSHFSVLQGC